MEKRIGVLFVSRRNSLRSVLAESCLIHLGGKKFRVLSCGQPGHIALGVHPAAIGALAMASIPIAFDTPRDWNALVRSGAPMVDFVITLDAELAHDLPRWPGQPDVAVWEYPDAASLRSGEDAAVTAIRTLYSLHRRLEFLIALPLFLLRAETGPQFDRTCAISLTFDELRRTHSRKPRDGATLTHSDRPRRPHGLILHSEEP